MIEQKLIVGRYIELNTPPPTLMGPPAHGFQTVAPVMLHIEESSSKSAPVAQNPVMPGFNPTWDQKVKIGAQRAGQHVASAFDRQRTSEVGVGASAKVHRNFYWLEWLPGLVSEIQPGGVDVLTGPMSGCWITSYLRNGVHYVGHVGTDMEHGSANSITARGAWNAWAAGVPMGAYSGFNPFNDPFPGVIPPAGAGEAARKTFALVTAAGNFYTIVAYPQLARPKRIRIAAIQQNHSTMPANGQIP